MGIVNDHIIHGVILSQSAKKHAPKSQSKPGRLDLAMLGGFGGGKALARHIWGALYDVDKIGWSGGWAKRRGAA